MNQKRKAALDSKAGELAQSVTTCAPVPVEFVARRLGAEIRYEPAEDHVSGMAWKSADSAVIGVNSLHSKTRKRFTIAHEIAHLVLHDDEAFHVDEGYALIGRRDTAASQGVHRKEIEANYFAAALLMPVAFLQRDADVLKLRFDFESDDALRAMARRYEVSQQALTIRLWEVFGINISSPRV